MSVGNNVPFMGYDSIMGLCEEATYGTFKTATAWCEFNSESIKAVREEKVLEQISGSRHFKKRMLGNETIDGSIEMNLNLASDFVCKLIKQALGGTVTSTTITAAQYTHTFYVGNMEANAGSTGANVKGLSVSVRRGDTHTFNYSGGRVNNLTIKGEVGSPVMVTADMVFNGWSTASTIGAATFSDVLPVNFTGVTMQTADNVPSLATEYFKSFELSINNNLVTDFRVLGNKNIVQAPPVMCEVKLKLSQAFDTLTSINRSIQNTLTAFGIVLDSGITITSSAGSTTYACKIQIPAVYFNSCTPQVGDNGMLNYDIDATALYGSTLGSTIKFVVNNATEKYAG